MDHNDNKGSKVESRTTSPTSLMVDVSKRLRIVAEATEAPVSAAAGILAGLNKHGSMLASTSNRDGIKEVLDIIAPLTAVVKMSKRTIRRRQGLVVTPAMQADLRELLAWHAKRCGASLVGDEYKPVEVSKKSVKQRHFMKTTKQQQTIPGMEAKERRLVAKIQPGTVQRSASSSTLNSNATTAAPSTESSNSSESGSSRIPSPELRPCVVKMEIRGVVYFARVAQISPEGIYLGC